MLTLRKSADRGHGDHGWLDSWHTFSFADYRDPAHNGFRILRVMNEDRVAPGQGFGMHPHHDMEIVSYVLEGALRHRDTLGHQLVLRPGEVQRITAGMGIEHSEFNPSASEPAHFYQIWLFPDRRGVEPHYAQQSFDANGRKGKWQTIVSPDGREASLTIRQDATICLSDLETNEVIQRTLAPGRHAWLQVLRGEVAVESLLMSAGDGLAISEMASLNLRGVAKAEVMLLELP